MAVGIGNLTTLKTFAMLRNPDDPARYKWHQIIRDKIGYLFFNIASICTDPACKMHEKVTFLKLSRSETQELPKDIKQLAQKASLIGQICLLFPVSIFTGSIGMVFRLLGYFMQYSEFNYFTGEAKEKPWPTDDNKLSVFFLNTCFIGGGFPLTHGGVLPWKSRIDKIVENIKNQNANIVCLSEVYDFKAAQMLYSKLKDQYAYFYLNIGPHHWAAKSGLFVASKYKIQNPHFIDFHDTLVHNKSSNRKGCFAFDVVNKKEPLGRIYSTHFEYSLNDSEPSAKEKKARKEEVDLIVKDIANSALQSPILLTGDFNFSEQEYSETQLEDYFTKTLISNRASYSGTCRRDEFNNRLWNKKTDKQSSEDTPYDLDHTFILTRFPKDYINGQHNYLRRYGVTTKIVPSFDEESEILSALSDHHAMMSEISLS